MDLTKDEGGLLRRLAVTGHMRRMGISDAVFSPMNRRGFVRYANINGSGRWIEITKRGILKAMVEGVIEHHPNECKPMVNLTWTHS